MTIQWRWLFWQVLFPLVGPIAFSFWCVFLWNTGPEKFTPKWEIVLDVSPWALTFFALALLGATLNEMWPKLSNYHPALVVTMFLVALSVGLYFAFTVIWRHIDQDVPPLSVYYVSVVLLGLAVVFCHMGYSRSRIQQTP